MRSLGSEVKRWPKVTTQRTGTGIGAREPGLVAQALHTLCSTCTRMKRVQPEGAVTLTQSESMRKGPSLFSATGVGGGGKVSGETIFLRELFLLFNVGS